MKRHKGITKLQPNKYQVRARITDPRTGERKEVKRVCDGTLDDALAMQKRIAEEMIDPRAQARVKLADYAQKWLEHRRSTIKRSTAKKYENDLWHILPALGPIYLDALRPRDVTEFLAAQSRRYAGWSVANRLRLLRTLAKDAVADGLAELDFCARVRMPQCNGYSDERPNCLTAEQLDALIRAIPAAWYALFATTAFTGLRWGEVSALRWEDVDHERGVICVQRNNWKGLITKPKTIKSRRTVPMVDRLGEILRAHRQRMLVEQHPGLAAGWVFPTAQGTLHRGTPLGPILRKALATAGIKVHLTPHGLRRTFNDLARRVAAAQVVRAIVGHVTEAMTEHYSMVDAGEKRAVQAAVLRLVGGEGERENSPKGEDLREGGAPSPAQGPEKSQ